MKISYFFRKKSPIQHSIENIFDAVISNIENYETEKHEVPFHSHGFVDRLKIAFFAKNHQADINHITGDIHFIAPFLKKNKTILTVHDIRAAKYGNIFRRSLLRFFWFSIPLRTVKFITVISEFTKQELIKHFKIKPSKIFIINNCISDNYTFQKTKLLGKKPVILQIGTKENKNLQRVINAIQDIECKLVIIGQLTPKQSKILKEKNIDYQNFYNLTEQEMINKYTESDIVLFASIYEGFGMPIIEANAIGRPVITSNLEPMNSVAGNAALLVNPFSVDDIREGLDKLINDEGLRNELISNGLENVKQFRAKTIAQQYSKLYAKISESTQRKN